MSLDWSTLIATNLIPVICVVIAVAILKKRKVKKIGKDGLEFFDTSECGALQQKHEFQLSKIEKLLEDDVQERKVRQADFDKKFQELDTGLNEVRNAIIANDELTGKTSEGTLTNLLFNDAIWPFLRMKSFRRLLALKKNGRIWEKGFNLISGSKEYQNEWLNVQEEDLDIEIVDEEYYYGRLREIENRITHDFSKRTA